VDAGRRVARAPGGPSRKQRAAGGGRGQEQLARLRAKLAATKAQNQEAVARAEASGREEEEERTARRREATAKRRERGAAAGEHVRATTAEEALWCAERARKKGKPRAAAYAAHDAAACHQSYRRRSRNLPYDKEAYEAQAQALGPAMYPDPNAPLSAPAAAGTPGADNVETMRAELAKQEERRAQFSRRRAYREDQDVDYINSRNRNFNKKVARAFDPYTAEIKQNLERGTAI